MSLNNQLYMVVPSEVTSFSLRYIPHSRVLVLILALKFPKIKNIPLLGMYMSHIKHVPHVRPGSYFYHARVKNYDAIFRISLFLQL